MICADALFIVFLLDTDMRYALVYGNVVWSTESVRFPTCVIIVTFCLSHQTVAQRGVLLFAFAFGDRDCLAWGLLEFDLMRVSIGIVLCRGRAVIRSFLQIKKQGRQHYWAMGFYVKTVLVILFEGFPNR